MKTGSWPGEGCVVSKIVGPNGTRWAGRFAKANKRIPVMQRVGYQKPKPRFVVSRGRDDIGRGLSSYPSRTETSTWPLPIEIHGIKVIPERAPVVSRRPMRNLTFAVPNSFDILLPVLLVAVLCQRLERVLTIWCRRRLFHLDSGPPFSPRNFPYWGALHADHALIIKPAAINTLVQLFCSDIDGAPIWATVVTCSRRCSYGIPATRWFLPRRCHYDGPGEPVSQVATA